MINSLKLLDKLSNLIDIEDSNLEDFYVYGPSVLSNIKKNTFIFLKNPKKNIKFPSDVIVFIEDSSIKHNLNNYILTDNCRLAFAICIDLFFRQNQANGRCHSSIISKSSNIHENSSVGSFVKIGDGVTVSKNVIIESHCYIADNVFIGEGTYIKSGAKVGVQGFGFERDSQDIPIRIWHSGGVYIGSFCEIGSNTVICSGTIEPTVINNFVKIDDNVHLTHNCEVGDRTMIAGCVSIGGSVSIGKDVWIGPNSSIINKVSIGDRANIVLGSVVMRDIEDDKIYMKNNKSKFTIE